MRPVLLAASQRVETICRLWGEGGSAVCGRRAHCEPVVLRCSVLLSALSFPSRDKLKPANCGLSCISCLAWLVFLVNVR